MQAVLQAQSTNRSMYVDFVELLQKITRLHMLAEVRNDWLKLTFNQTSLCMHDRGESQLK